MKQYAERYLDNIEKAVWVIIGEHRRKLGKRVYVSVDFNYHTTGSKTICVWDNNKHTYFDSLIEYQDYVAKLPEPPEG